MGWKIRLRSGEGCNETQPFLSPDIVIQNFDAGRPWFDHELAYPEETQNKLGLASRQALHTAIVIQLFTDRRIRPEMDHLDPFNPDPRGWWGDTVDVREDIGEQELGSHLWTLRRSILTNEVVALAADYTHEALQPIADQGAVAEFSVETEAQSLRTGQGLASSILAIGINGYSQRGTKIYEQHFDALWREQIANLITA